jgi:hypothetical protein
MPEIPVEGWGVDLPREVRPGVPREHEPQADPGAHWISPEWQVSGEEALEREGLPRMTPVYGTAQPPRGVSGWLRRRAYRVPDYRASHWMALLFADRVEVLGFRLRQVWPLAAVAGAAGAGLWALRRLGKT